MEEEKNYKFLGFSKVKQLKSIWENAKSKKCCSEHKKLESAAKSMICVEFLRE